MRALDLRVAAMEARPPITTNLLKMTDAQLMATLTPHFGGREPTDAELIEFIERKRTCSTAKDIPTGDQHGNA